MALQGAEILFYPTAIGMFICDTTCKALHVIGLVAGNEPQNPSWDSSSHWQRVQQGHAAANIVPLVAANRYGTMLFVIVACSKSVHIHDHSMSPVTLPSSIV